MSVIAAIAYSLSPGHLLLQVKSDQILVQYEGYLMVIGFSAPYPLPCLPDSLSEAWGFKKITPSPTDMSPGIVCAGRH